MSQQSKEKRRAAQRLGRTRISAVWLIYAREMRDQLRDRRTLFTIAVLPILLYPLVGTLLLQVAQFTRQQPTSVCVIGGESQTVGPKLIVEDEFDAAWLENEQKADLWNVATFTTEEIAEYGSGSDVTQKWIQSGLYDVALIVPPNFSEQADQSTQGLGAPPQLELLYHVGSDQSMIAKARVESILNRWRSRWVTDRLERRGIDAKKLEPFRLSQVDTAPVRTRGAAFWSKLLPFVMLVWAMTGAFYPAIDLVAGEKERGTLETILCSPALRSEIVWGKLAAVTTFSMMTAILNAGSMLLTSSFVFQQIGAAGAISSSPPLIPMLWLLVALIPLSALFSALALGVAAMARSSKEGQYYLMPLMMVTLPLVMLPMLPGTTLSIGTSVIPVTGMFLLVRSLVEGQYGTALMYFPIVMGVTLFGLHVAVSWARKQFESESVLFGGGDGWELRHWVRHLWRDRQMAATAPQALACGAIILVALFFGKLAVSGVPTTISGIAKLIILPQIGLILAPALLMATMLTTSLKDSLRIRWTPWTTIPLSVLLGISLHPTYVYFGQLVKEIYPISPTAAESMRPFVEQIQSADWGLVVFLMAVVPAVCEELAFRGFIFGGLVRGQSRIRAVIITALFFGLSHGVLQQSITATAMGLMLGWVTLRTGSVIPCIIIHLTSNAMSVSLERIAQTQWGGVELFLTVSENDIDYSPLWIATSIPVAIATLAYLSTAVRSDSDQQSDRIDAANSIQDPGKHVAGAVPVG